MGGLSHFILGLFFLLMLPAMRQRASSRFFAKMRLVERGELLFGLSQLGELF